MGKAVMDKELIVTAQNKIGALAEVAGVLASGGLNIIAITAYVCDDKGVVICVTEDNQKAKGLLAAKKYDVSEEEIIIASLDNKPGALESVTKKIAKEGVDLKRLYGSVDDKTKTSRIVIVSCDNRAALAAINK